MDWLQGPLSEHDIFWFGWQVFWWKRAVAIAQTALAFSIVLNLMTAEKKRRLHESLMALEERTAGVKVPAVIRMRVVLMWCGVAVVVLATLASMVVTVQQNGRVLPGLASWILFAAILGIASIYFASVLKALSILWTSAKAVQRHAPPILAWLFHQQRFDRTVVFGQLIAVVAVGAVQLALS